MSYSQPIVITAGGTYSGNWESTDPNTAAITVSTTAAVTIQNCRIRSKGHLILSLLNGTNITVRNCVGLGINPNVAGTAFGRFASLYGPKSLTLTNNTMTSTAGIYIDGAGQTASGIVITNNIASNIEGRLSDGNNSYQSSAINVQFTQLNNVRAATGVDISWNQIINQPKYSRVEDNINIYLSSGTAASPISVTNNYIQGAYPENPATDGFSGGGIIVDGASSSTSTAAGYITISNNQIVGTSNYGIAIAAGHDIKITNNRTISSGLLSDGSVIKAANVGIYVANWSSAPTSTFGNFTVSMNTIGWNNSNGIRNDWWFPDCPGTSCSSNTSVSGGALTLAMEATELVTWTAKLLANAKTLGSTLTN